MNFLVNLIGPDEHTVEKRTLLLVIVEAPEQLWFYNTVMDDLKIYSDSSTKEKENKNSPSSLIEKR